MIEEIRPRVAILSHRDREAGENAPPEKGRFGKVFQALAELGMRAEPAIYHDEVRDEIRRQLIRMDGVLVWVNPVEGERDRSVLDATLREVAASGVFVSAHPDIILKLGTKEVLYRTQGIRCAGSFLRDRPPGRSGCSSSTAGVAGTGSGRSSVRPMQRSIGVVAARHGWGTKHWSAPGTRSGDVSRKQCRWTNSSSAAS